MPHIVVEYAKDRAEQLKKSDLLAALRETVVASGLFAPEAVKARTMGFDDYLLPEGQASFVHVTVSILSGRNPEQRKTLAASVFDTLRSTLPEGGALSVDIREMDRESYHKMIAA